MCANRRQQYRLLVKWSIVVKWLHLFSFSWILTLCVFVCCRHWPLSQLHKKVFRESYYIENGSKQAQNHNGQTNEVHRKTRAIQIWLTSSASIIMNICGVHLHPKFEIEVRREWTAKRKAAGNRMWFAQNTPFTVGFDVTEKKAATTTRKHIERKRKIMFCTFCCLQGHRQIFSLTICTQYWKRKLE